MNIAEFFSRRRFVKDLPSPINLRTSVENIHTIDSGLVLYKQLIEYATKASEDPNHEGTDESKLEEQIWRVLDLLTLRLHELDYAFQLSVQTPKGIITVPFPLAIDFVQLERSISSGSFDYYMRPFRKSPSHTKHPQLKFDDTHAFDFIVPSGVPVRAVANGIVTHSQLDSDKGGNDPRFGNFDNRVYTYDLERQLYFVYRHLAFTAPEHRTLHVDAQVHTGQTLGSIGLTGWSTTPHLHFVVYQESPHTQFALQSLPIDFAKKHR